MLGKTNKNTIDCLIGSTTHIKGEVNFKGGLRIDGHITGNINADGDASSVLVVSEHAKIKGQVKAVHLIVNGEIEGDIYSVELIELQPNARIIGNIYYKALEMHSGAKVTGKLNPDHEASPSQVIKLPTASGNEA